jgi:hypothetical protein
MSSTSCTHPLHLEHDGGAQNPSRWCKICIPIKFEEDTARRDTSRRVPG